MSFQEKLKTIVVATDLDGRSDAALEYARKLAVPYAARIVLAHGLDPLDYAAVDSVPEKILSRLSLQAQSALEKMAGDLIREGIRSHSDFRQGAVVEMLVDVARQYDAGLIVVGTEGFHGAGPVIVGTIAEQLVRMAPCPVLAVAADWNAGAFRPTPGGPVLLAIERNEATEAAVAAAVSLAETFARPLLVLHAQDASSAPLNPCASTLADFGIVPSEKLVVQCMVREGTPEQVIAEAVAEFLPCILVAGAKRSSQTPGQHGTAFTLLAHSRVPVLCVPPETVHNPAKLESCSLVM
jgi:nucleotide-binding universal stress UspA family protein